MEKKLQKTEDNFDKYCLNKENRSFKEIIFENKMSKLIDKLYNQMDESYRLDILIKHNLEEIEHGKFMGKS
ncbi:hypothetical protein LN736_01680 [Clostridium sp. WLY-B-L2]|uniref:Uncharacterized protein n=1 Tax=Clostridium aromativorans TaxID=2836848 RepID=A0ABS8N1A7_9CLOT|nr:hypothetical protein [Clostridium aromativorans]MCC9293584.1 hypothetical protein [Clostridium aromativorans]